MPALYARDEKGRESLVNYRVQAATSSSSTRCREALVMRLGKKTAVTSINRHPPKAADRPRSRSASYEERTHRCSSRAPAVGSPRSSWSRRRWRSPSGTPFRWSPSKAARRTAWASRSGRRERCCSASHVFAGLSGSREVQPQASSRLQSPLPQAQPAPAGAVVPPEALTQVPLPARRPRRCSWPCRRSSVSLRCRRDTSLADAVLNRHGAPALVLDSSAPPAGAAGARS